MESLRTYINEQCNVRFEFKNIRSKKCISNQIRQIELVNKSGIACNLANLLYDVSHNNTSKLIQSFPEVGLKIHELDMETFGRGINGYERLRLLVKLLVAGCKSFESIADQLNDTGIFFRRFNKPVFDENHNVWKITNSKDETLYVYVK